MDNWRSDPANEAPVSPQEAADRLGFSCQHVIRLIQADELPANELPGTSGWQIPTRSILAFEERREVASQRADEHARALDRIGAPLE
ncbi:MAG: hypothetical protein ITG02_06195 [Patulibacter sp.]|nr:hypothetical protein [Patulibacter sp.]